MQCTGGLQGQPCNTCRRFSSRSKLYGQPCLKSHFLEIVDSLSKQALFSKILPSSGESACELDLFGQMEKPRAGVEEDDYLSFLEQWQDRGSFKIWLTPFYRQSLTLSCFQLRRCLLKLKECPGLIEKNLICGRHPVNLSPYFGLLDWAMKLGFEEDLAVSSSFSRLLGLRQGCPKERC